MQKNTCFCNFRTPFYLKKAVIFVAAAEKSKNQSVRT